MSITLLLSIKVVDKCLILCGYYVNKNSKKYLQKSEGLAILESSGTTYFDSLTEIKIESGKPSGALKITGDSELHLKRKARKSLEKAKVVNGVL